MLPERSLQSTDGPILNLPSGLDGSWTLLYYYPKDDTPGCTVQACSYRDHISDFEEVGARIYGISLDDLESHEAFRGKFGLSFPLLVDVADGLCADLGVYRQQEWKGKTFMGLGRDSFLVNPEGRIVKVWRQVNPQSTMDETLEELRRNL